MSDLIPTQAELGKALIANILAAVVIAIAIKHSSTLRGLLK